MVGDWRVACLRVSDAPPPKDDEELYSTSVAMPRWLAERLSEAARQRRQSRSQLIVTILEAWLKENKLTPKG